MTQTLKDKEEQSGIKWGKGDTSQGKRTARVRHSNVRGRQIWGTVSSTTHLEGRVKV